jgi:hypothetical protein
MADLDARVNALEQRMDRLEQALRSGQSAPAATPAPAVGPAWEPRARAAPAAPRPAPAPSASGEPLTATRVLGWGGALALMLAAVYMIRLAIDSGWFTPARQVALAAIGGVVLIGTGLVLRQYNRQYAALLPAVGIVILYLCTYGAHLLYAMIPAQAATGAVIAISIASLWLGRVFDSSLYALFAVVGAYSTPLLLPVLRAGITDLVIYFTAWSVSFSLYSIWEGNRRTYMLAMFLALIGFDIVWRQHGGAGWIAAVVYQLLQFGVFAATAAAFSIRLKQPLDTGEAWWHAGALLIFYFVEYSLLDRHVPQAAPWIAMASAAVLLALYFAAQRFLAEPSRAGAVLVSAYAALVLFHAGYIESLPDEWTPWVALMLPVAIGFVAARFGGMPKPALPFAIGIGCIFVFNYLRVIADMDLRAVPGEEALRTIYAISLYIGYALCVRTPPLAGWGRALLYAAHLAAMIAAIDLFDSGISVSVAWAVLAIGCLGVAIRRRNRFLGQSSFLIFIASALKVLIFDLSGSAATTRILTLIVLGVSLYAGGWLYQRLVATTAES